MQCLKLGVIGFSEGNGHPYSWTAICNGYDEVRMRECGYPVIPEYLSRQSFPSDMLDARVVSVWSEDRAENEKLAATTFIPKIEESLPALLERVDAVLLLRDDPEHRNELLPEILASGKPVFVDKPFAYSVSQAQELFTMARSDWQIFTCSAMRYSSELKLPYSELLKLQDDIWIEAEIGKSWSKYAIHLIEPVLNNFFDNRFPISCQSKVLPSGQQEVTAKFNHGAARFVTRAQLSCPFLLRIWSKDGSWELRANDTFNPFRTALKAFFQQVSTQTPTIPVEQTLAYLSVVEAGLQ